MVRRASVAIVGVGHTRYGRLPEYDAYELGLWALNKALADAGLAFEDIDGLIVNRIPDYQRFCEIAGINPGLCQHHARTGPLLRHLHRDRRSADPRRARHDRRAGLRQQWPLGRRPLWRRRRQLRQRRRRQLVSLWHDLARRVPRADGAPAHGALRHECRTSSARVEDVPRSRRAQSGGRDA